MSIVRQNKIGQAEKLIEKINKTYTQKNTLCKRYIKHKQGRKEVSKSNIKHKHERKVDRKRYMKHKYKRTSYVKET